MNFFLNEYNKIWLVIVETILVEIFVKFIFAKYENLTKIIYEFEDFLIFSNKTFAEISIHEDCYINMA